jgi:hypothetical protein
MLRGYRDYLTPAGRWVKKNWRYPLVLAGCLFGSALAWIIFSPAPPNLPAYNYSNAAHADHYPGGPSCKPAALAALSGVQAATERIRCADAAEEYRLKASDLAQQTRAADAAQASVALGFVAIQITLLGLIIGFLTMVAALFAARYAKKAADSARDSHNLQEKALQIQTRPFLVIKDFTVEELPRDFEFNRFEITCHVENMGVLPAVNVRFEYGWWLGELRHALENVRIDRKPTIISHCPRGITRRAVMQIDLTDDELKQLWRNEAYLALLVRFTFDHRYKEGKVIEEGRHCTGDTFYEGEFALSPPKDVAGQALA